PPLLSTLFPYTTLFRSSYSSRNHRSQPSSHRYTIPVSAAASSSPPSSASSPPALCWYHLHFNNNARKCATPCTFNSPPARIITQDRKSTRLNSSHVSLS